VWGSEEEMNDKDKDVSSGIRDSLAQCSKTLAVLFLSFIPK